MISKYAKMLVLTASFMFVMIVPGVRNPVLLSSNLSPTPTNIGIGTVSTDDYGFEMVYVPSGEYEMGTTEDEFKTVCEDAFKGSAKICSDLVSETKDIQNFQKRRVKVTSFWIDRFEVTIEQYQVCVLSGACRPIGKAYNSKLDDDPRKPQYSVTWYDAMFFCNVRRARLPTEMEWEYTARGPDDFIFPWGNTYNRNYLSPYDATIQLAAFQKTKAGLVHLIWREISLNGRKIASILVTNNLRMMLMMSDALFVAVHGVIRRPKSQLLIELMLLPTIPTQLLDFVV